MRLSRDQIAKNLLAEKTCDTCVCGFDKECSYNAKRNKLRLKSKDNTCQHWKLREYQGIDKIILPIIRMTFPSTIAGELASSWPEIDKLWENRKKKKDEN